MEKEKMLTPDKVAERINLSSKTVRLWLRQGKLAGRKLGPRLWRVRERDLQTFLERLDMIPPGEVRDHHGQEVFLESSSASQDGLKICKDTHRARVFLLKSRHNRWGQIVDVTVEQKGKEVTIDGNKLIGLFKILEDND
jgi:excisionase family DNA binding protein